MVPIKDVFFDLQFLYMIHRGKNMEVCPQITHTTTGKRVLRTQGRVLIMMEELADDEGVCLLTCGIIFRGCLIRCRRISLNLFSFNHIGSCVSVTFTIFYKVFRLK